MPDDSINYWLPLLLWLDYDSTDDHSSPINIWFFRCMAGRSLCLTIDRRPLDQGTCDLFITCLLIVHALRSHHSCLFFQSWDLSYNNQHSHFYGWPVSSLLPADILLLLPLLVSSSNRLSILLFNGRFMAVVFWIPSLMVVVVL